MRQKGIGLQSGKFLRTVASVLPGEVGGRAMQKDSALRILETLRFWALQKLYGNTEVEIWGPDGDGMASWLLTLGA